MWAWSYPSKGLLTKIKLSLALSRLFLLIVGRPQQLTSALLAYSPLGLIKQEGETKLSIARNSSTFSSLITIRGSYIVVLIDVTPLICCVSFIGNIGKVIILVINYLVSSISHYCIMCPLIIKGSQIKTIVFCDDLQRRKIYLYPCPVEPFLNLRASKSTYFMLFRYVMLRICKL